MYVARVICIIPDKKQPSLSILCVLLDGRGPTMTAVVQPDLGPPPAHKYKDDPSDDSVSAEVYCFLFSLFPCLDENTMRNMNGRMGSCLRANWDALLLLESQIVYAPVSGWKRNQTQQKARLI